MTKRRLSHSQVNMYALCPKKYFYHYSARLREPVTSAALLFGSALDKTVNEILVDYKADKPKTLEHYYSIFANSWHEQRINNEVVSLPTSLQIVYADSDFDAELIPTEYYQKICLEYPGLEYAPLAEKKKMIGLENMPVREAEFINLLNWHSLFTKGRLMVESFITKILPQIKEVIAVQKKIELKNDDGDSVIGYLDHILDFGDGPRVSDLKTSTRDYKDDSANISSQLAVYAYVEGIENTAFIVFYKQIKKNRVKICSKCGHNGTGSRAKTCDLGEGKARCHGEWNETINPEADCEVIYGTVHEVFSNNVLDNYEETLKAINAGAYPRNFNSCTAYGCKCPYFDMCHTGSGEEKLIKV